MESDNISSVLRSVFIMIIYPSHLIMGSIEQKGYIYKEKIWKENSDLFCAIGIILFCSNFLIGIVTKLSINIQNGWFDGFQ